jgi:ABC-type bacteriocin/lantibiotic exporter with double-glycine peptidase domain
MAGIESNISLSRSIRKFIEIIRLEKREVSAIYFYAILSGLIQLSLPLGIQAIINFAQIALGRSKMPASMWLLMSLVVGGVFVAGLLQVNQMKVVEKIQQRIFSRYALDFTYKIPRLEHKAVDGYHIPELVNRFFDVVVLQKALSKILLDIPLAVVQVLFALILLSFYNSLFVILGILLVFISYLIFYYTGKRGLEASIRESNYKYDIAAWIEEVARGFKSFKITGKYNLHLSKTDQLLKGYLRARTDHFLVLKFQYWSLVGFKLSITAAMLIIGVILLMNQQLNIGQFIAAEIVILTVLLAVEKLILSLDQGYDILTSLEKLSSVTDKSVEQSAGLLLPKEHRGMKIEMRNLSFGYEENRPLLKEINLAISSGQKVCIMGDAGAGKSVLMEMMTGSLLDYDGVFLVNDLPLRNYSIQSFRENMGVFYHEQDIFKGTLYENITMGNNDVGAHALMKIATQIGLGEYISSLPLGLQTILQPTGKGLSTVIAKKILLLRAVIGSPSLLLMDEPFELAGAEHAKDIAEHILGMKETTAIIVTGNLDFARQCDQVFILSNGVIAQTQGSSLMS